MNNLSALVKFELIKIYKHKFAFIVFGFACLYNLFGSMVVIDFVKKTQSILTSYECAVDTNTNAINMFVALIMIAPIFTQEYSAKMMSTLYSCKNSKSFMVMAKIITTLIVSVGVSMIMMSVRIIPIMLSLGIAGGDIMLQTVAHNATLNINLSQVLIYQCFLNIIACAVSSIIVAFTSLKAKSVIIPLLLGIILLLLIPKLLLSALATTSFWAIGYLFPINLADPSLFTVTMKDFHIYLVLYNLFLYFLTVILIKKTINKIEDI